jgi:glyoxylase-like metal-dependent hydrolase (beta-lactamase superfamily II)
VAAEAKRESDKMKNEQQDYLIEQFRVPRGCLGYVVADPEDLVSILLPGKILAADALLIGSCGRTDLLNGNATRQYHTLYYTYKSLPDNLTVYPGHDYNSRQCSTLGDEKQNNPKMLFHSEEEFVEYMDLENPKKLGSVEHLAEALKANMN